MLKTYEKNGKTIILDTKSGNWVRMNTVFYETNKNSKNFHKLLEERYFKNSNVCEEKIDTIYLSVTGMRTKSWTV